MDNERGHSSKGSGCGDYSKPHKKECVIVDKVYANCQFRECFTNVEVDLGTKKICSVKFKEGFILPGTLRISELPDKEHFRRVRFTLRVPYEVKTKCGKTISAYLPDIKKDIILFMPESRDEFEFKIVVETSSKILGKICCDGDKCTFTVGVFAVVKAVGKVQLMIPAYGYCPEPCKCMDYSEDDICEEFDNLHFPDLFPVQQEDVWDEINK